ncbi:MAG: hypothetical protein VXZ78_03640 [Pseudomonadota bacterium]|nr:hypothetical protein [Pseudomonadota bacterium]
MSGLVSCDPRDALNYGHHIVAHCPVANLQEGTVQLNSLPAGHEV